MGYVIAAVVLIASYWYMRETKSRVADGQVVQDNLTKKEKTIIWVASFLDPVVAGAVFYYGWKKKMPVKAREANHISMIALLISIAGLIVWAYVFGPESIGLN